MLLFWTNVYQKKCLCASFERPEIWKFEMTKENKSVLQRHEENFLKSVHVQTFFFSCSKAENINSP